MATDFKTSTRRYNGSLHLALNGHSDDSSASEFFHFIQKLATATSKSLSIRVF